MRTYVACHQTTSNPIYLFKGALLKFGNKIGKAEFPSHLKITEYNIYTPLPYQVIKWSLFLKTYT